MALNLRQHLRRWTTSTGIGGPRITSVPEVEHDCRVSPRTPVSPLRKGDTVDVLRMAAEDACEHDMLVQIRWRGRKMAVPLSQLAAVDPDESTDEAVGDWIYWVAQGYCL